MKNHGFTLIELTIAIIIIGILAAVAVPRFINLKQDATEAKIIATTSVFEAGIKQARLAWEIKGNGVRKNPLKTQEVPSEILRKPKNKQYLDFNRYGWPSGATGNANNSRALQKNNACMTIWYTIMHTSPPLLCNRNGGKCNRIINDDYKIKNSDIKSDAPEQFVTTTKKQVCYYTYGDSAYTITYFPKTGKVTHNI